MRTTQRRSEANCRTPRPRAGPPRTTAAKVRCDIAARLSRRQRADPAQHCLGRIARQSGCRTSQHERHHRHRRAASELMHLRELAVYGIDAKALRNAFATSKTRYSARIPQKCALGHRVTGERGKCSDGERKPCQTRHGRAPATCARPRATIAETMAAFSPSLVRSRTTPRPILSSLAGSRSATRHDRSHLAPCAE